MVNDLGCGRQSNLSSGTRSRVFRVLAISWSNSGSKASLIFMLSSSEDIRLLFALCQELFGVVYACDRARTIARLLSISSGLLKMWVHWVMAAIVPPGWRAPAERAAGRIARPTEV